MKPLAANTLLQNRYLIVHLIGKGGMGDVYLAIDQRLGSAVALKRTFFAGDEIFADAFEREARTLARLKHGVLPKVTDHFTEGEMQFLIMEHIAGEDLAKRLELSQKPFPVDWVMFWADQLLDALNYLHSQEPPVIHRDIKPQNLKLTDDNSVILLDFGLSKNTVGEMRSAATTGSVVGYTPHFAPLEQIRGTGTNPRSDIYSLAATLYQLLTNVAPPETLIRAENILSGKPDPIKPVFEINNEVSQAVSDIILKGMEVSQEKRFPTAREMQKALRESYTETQTRDSKQIETLTAPIIKGNSQISEAALKTNVGSISSIADQSPLSSPQKNSVRVEDNFLPAPTKKPQTFFLTIIGLAVPIILATAAIGWLLMHRSATDSQKNDGSTTANTQTTPSPQTAMPTATNSVEVSNPANSDNFNANTDFQNNAQNNSENNNPRIQNSAEKSPRTTQNPNVKTPTKQLERPKTTTKTTPKPTPSSKITPLPRILP